MSKSKAHVRYHLPDKKRTIVPGTTTITGNQLGWNKRVLINWANRMGLEDIDTNLYVNELAEIGTLAHLMVTDWLQGKKTNTDDFSKNQIAAAENSFLSFLEWAKGKDINIDVSPLLPPMIETPLVSTHHRFGGTCDILAVVNGEFELIDLKTGEKGIFDEMIVQVAAYAELLRDGFIQPKDWRKGEYVPVAFDIAHIRILSIPRTESEAFLERVVSRKHREVSWKIFKHALANHRLQKELS